ncbi:hypothetical protein F7725_019449 [Dissostichus mawsoni]|uniref:Secreted protein n=1 Tax=Dissostichus mawsoni TaxID=36200 RepID=A0A7J5YK29_DISMA|nr:hypothetical protein F7725_019449 [Dissostichus mawsoni]
MKCCWSSLLVLITASRVAQLTQVWVFVPCPGLSRLQPHQIALLLSEALNLSQTRRCCKVFWADNFNEPKISPSFECDAQKCSVIRFVRGRQRHRRKNKSSQTFIAAHNEHKQPNAGT